LKKKKLSEFAPIFNRPLYQYAMVYREGERWILEAPRIVLEIAMQDEDVKNFFGDFEGREVKSDVLSSKRYMDLRKTGVLYGEALSFEMTPASFLVSDNNRKAYESSMAALYQKGISLLIYGVPGVGKTHLLHAVGWYALNKLLYKVAFFTSSKLIDLIHESFNEKTTAKMKEILADVDLLLIDDFQNFDRKMFNFCIDFVFTIVDKLILLGKRVIVTSDVKSDLWKNIPTRLEQRLTLGGSIPVHPPDEKFVKDFLDISLKRAGIKITKDALEVVSNLKFSNVRKLKAFVNFLAARNKPVVTRNDLYYAALEVLGEEGFVDEKEITLGSLWRRVVETFFDPFEAESILRGERVSGDLNKKLQYTKIAFASVMKERDVSPSEMQRVFNVSRAAVYKWLSKEEELKGQPIYEAVKAKVEEVVKMYTGGK